MFSESVLLALLAATAKALPAATTTFACNPAHSYPNGASCISTAGSLTLVTPAASTTYACNPAHSYPNGASCISTAGSLTLVTPTTAASTTYACNPAHTACATVSGQLVPATSTTPLICNAAAIARGACTASAASVPTTAAASAASSVVSAAATAASSSGETIAQGLTWTVENLSRYCSPDRTGCDYNFNLTASDDRQPQACTIIRENVKDAPLESWYNIPCDTDSPINVSWGYSAQFGADHAFAVMTVVNEEERAKAYFGVADVNGQPVTTAPSNPFGSGQYGNIGPQVVYLF